MLIVNFISAQRAQQLRYRLIGDNLVRVILGTGLLFMIIMFYNFFNLMRLRAKINEVNLIMASYQPQAEQVNQIHQEIDLLTPRVQLVQSSVQNLDHWLTFYAEIARSTPDDVRLEMISVNKEGGADTTDNLVTLEGKGENAKAVSQMALALNAQPGISDVLLGQVNLLQQNQATLNLSLKLASPSSMANAAGGNAPSGQP